MLKNLFVYALIFLSLQACVKHKAIEPLPVHRINLAPQDGLISEPIFGGQVYIKSKGNPAGPVIVLIHGLGDNASNIWAATIRKLEKKYFLLTLDLPGFGKSSTDNALYSPENYTRLIHHLSQKYVGRPFHLVGHSMGGAISLRYAATYPQDIQSLTLVDAAGILHRQAYTKYLAPLGLNAFVKYFQFDRKDVSSLAGFILNKVENFIPLDPKLLVEDPTLRAKILRGNPSLISGMALVLDDFSQIPGKISAPTNIIWGENDEVAPLRTGYVLNALIPHSTLHTIAQTGHVPITSKPDKFHHLLMQGITRQKLSKQKRARPAPQNNTNCRYQNNIHYTGIIHQLSIQNCKNVLISDAQIGQLLLSDSRVFIQNSVFSSNKTTIKAVRSNIEITAGSIQGNIAIEAHESSLDIAGTRLSGQQAVITAPTPSVVVFSLSPKLAGGDQVEILHGRFNITADNPLL